MVRIVTKMLSDKLEENLDEFKKRNAVNDKDWFILVSEYADRFAIEKIEELELRK